MSTWIGRFIHPALLFVVLAWGINFSVVQVAYEKPLSPPVVAILRWAGTVLVMAVVMRLAGQDWKMTRADWIRTIVSGFIANGVYMILFLEGMAQVTAAQGAIALATAPIFTAFFAILARQDKFRWAWAVGSTVAFAGVAFATLGIGDRIAEPVSGTGVLIVVISAIVWAFSIIIMKPLLVNHHPIKVMSTSLLGAGLALVPYGFEATRTLDWSGVTARGWGALAYLILIAGAAAFVAYYKALQDIGPSRTTMVQYLVPPVAALASWAIQGKAIHAAHIVGLVLALGGLWLGSLRTKAEKAAAFANQPEPASE